MGKRTELSFRTVPRLFEVGGANEMRGLGAGMAVNGKVDRAGQGERLFARPVTARAGIRRQRFDSPLTRRWLSWPGSSGIGVGE